MLQDRSVKQRYRAVFRTGVIVSLLLCAGVFAIFETLESSQVNSAKPSHVGASHGVKHAHRRRLEENDPCAPLPANSTEARPMLCDALVAYGGKDAMTFAQIKNGGVILYMIGAIYMFAALAIVCDDFFVPSLEIVAERLRLSNEVGGATILATGGSAPELFVCFIGTFSDSSVGFGMVMGSAIFNVLIGMACCAIFSREPLELSWWPMTRDFGFYLLVLSMLAGFFMNEQSADWGCGDGQESCSMIEIGESITLVVMYPLYVLLIAYHHRVHALIQRIRGINPDGQDGRRIQPGAADKGNGEEQKDENPVPLGRTPLEKQPSAITKQMSMRKRDELKNLQMKKQKSMKTTDSIYSHNETQFRSPATFRAGFTQLMTQKNSLFDTTGASVVHRIQGDALELFELLDKDRSGALDKGELAELLHMLECAVTESALDEILKMLDTDGNGTVSLTEFEYWYTRSDKRIIAELDAAGRAQTDKGTLSIESVTVIMLQMHPEKDHTQLGVLVEAAFTSLGKSVSDEKQTMTLTELREWYKKSELWEEKQQSVIRAADASGGYELQWPKEGGAVAKVFFIVMFPVIVPVYYSMYYLNPGRGAARRSLIWGIMGFFFSLAWIALFSVLMVWWTEISGATCGIPAQVMGLIFLAAGTSVPDLISAIVVAKIGAGDVAVSSALGANIFDVTIALPLPWLLYSAFWAGRPVTIAGLQALPESEGITVLILMGMVIAVMLAVILSGWRMMKSLAYTMLGLWFVFVLVALLRYYGE